MPPPDERGGGGTDDGTWELGIGWLPRGLDEQPAWGGGPRSIQKRVLAEVKTERGVTVCARAFELEPGHHRSRNPMAVLEHDPSLRSDRRTEASPNRLREARLETGLADLCIGRIDEDQVER